MNIVLICPAYYGYETALRGALESLGHSVTLLPYFPHHTLAQKAANRLVHEVAPRVGVEGLLNRRLQLFNETAVEAVKTLHPQRIIVVKGEILQPETVEAVSALAPTAYWAPDDPHRHPLILDSLRYYTAIASFSRMDVARLRNEGSAAHFLPNGYSETIFGGHTSLKPNRRREVSFVGARYPEREQALKRAQHVASLGIWGGDWKRRPWRARFYQKRTPLDRATMGWADLPKSAAIYRSCPVNVNIHGSDWDGLNTRVFEIPGAGGFQLCDMRVGLEETFEPGKEIVVYRDSQEMTELIAYYSRHETERERIRAAGAARARRDHTLSRRMRTLLSFVE